MKEKAEKTEMTESGTKGVTTLVKFAIPVRQQSGRTHYAFAISGNEAHDLIARSLLKVDRWSTSNEDGYQRDPTPKRVSKFAQFVKQPDGWSPTSVLVYARYPDRVKVTEKDGVVQVRIEVDEDHPLYTPDGQHRLYGLKEGVDAEPTGATGDYELPVVLMVSHDGVDPRFEEAGQFYTINHFSKRVPTDLAERFRLRHLEKNHGQLKPADTMPMGSTRDQLKPYAVAIADMLNDDGAWKDLIDLPNSKGSTRPVSQTAFVDSLLPLLKHAADYRWDLGKIAGTVSTFWAAVIDRCPEAGNHWNGDSCTTAPGASHDTYVLRTTAGVYSLNEVLAYLVAHYKVGENPTDKKVYSKLLGMDMEHFSDAWWQSGKDAPEGGAAQHGTGRGSFSAIASDIRSELSGHLGKL